MKRHASMNRIYRLVWSKVRNAWIAVSENAKGQGKSGRGKSTLRRKALATALSLAFAPMVFAGPSGGQLIAGAGSISQVGAITTINQFSNNLSLNWQSFNVAQQESVNFQQPSAASIAINRILDTNGSQILGHLNANGQVWLINPNGILFGQNAQVNVGGLVASTLNLYNTDLSSGSYTFGTPLPQAGGGQGRGAVINQGTINVVNGGYIALLGNQVSNQGTLTAPYGTVALGAGSVTTLTFAGNSLLHLQVDQSTLNNLAENGGFIQADGGQVMLSAGAKDSVLASVVNNTGVIDARTVENKNGTIILLGGKAAGTVNVGGTLDASAPIPSTTAGGIGKGNTSGVSSKNGGFIETSAAHVKIADGAKVTTAAANGLTGSWLIDPDGFTIAASGGDMTGATLSANLNNSDVAIASTQGQGADGSINVNDTVTWLGNQLTLTATHDINVNATVTAKSANLLFTAGNDVNINAVMNANGSSFDFEPGSGNVNVGMNASGFTGQVNFYTSASGTTPRSGLGFLKIGGNDYTVITSVGNASGTAGLQAVNNDLTGYYALGGNLDASATLGWNVVAGQAAGFTPLGNDIDNFTGIFDGLGHTISNLIINRAATSNVGLFGYGNASVIRNVGLINSNINGLDNVGGLVGYNYGGRVLNNFASGTVIGAGDNIGGLVGANYGDGSIVHSYAATSLYVSGTANANVGGLVGYNYSGTVSDSYATGNVGGVSNVGGLVGNNSTTSAVNNSYATGRVTGANYVGGLVGINKDTGAINSSNATGEVSGIGKTIGGLVGANYGSIDHSNATGKVTGTGSASDNIGGLVGANYGSISNSHATTGSVSGASYVGGLVGINGSSSSTGTISKSYATSNVSATGANVGGLVGANYDTINQGCYATGTVLGSGDNVGGLAGFNYGTIVNAFASGDVNVGITAKNNIGGLVGLNEAVIANSYATGSVNGASYIGGLVGINGSSTLSDAQITNSYATGNVSGSSIVGGLVGHNGNMIEASYATGSVSGSSSLGGLAGSSEGNITNSFWNSDKTITDIGTIEDTATNINVNGLTASQMMQYSSYSSWNVATSNTISRSGGSGAVWRIYEGHTTPLLTSFLTPLTLSAADVQVGYNGATQYGQSTTLSNGVLGSAVSARNAGFYNSYYSTQQGYDISGGNLLITPKVITVTAAGSNKTYDASVNDTVVLDSTGIISGDTVSFASSTATFADKNVGTAKTVTVTGISTSGTDAGNYTLSNNTASTAADITAKALTVTATGINKVYDGSVNDAATLASAGVISGDSVIFSDASATFTNKNVGAAKPVSITGISVSGTDAGNYTLNNTTASTTADITAKAITVVATGINKTYDATVNDVVSLGSTGVITGDTVDFTNTSATFADKNVGISKTVSIAGISASGSDAANYTLNTTASSTADITAKAITVTATGVNKVYDASVSDAATLASAGVISGDVVTFSDTSATFANKNIGTAKTVSVAGISAGGTDAGNYTLNNTTASTTADITAKAITVVATGTNKTYDATVNDVVSLGSTGVITGDTVDFTSTSATFANKNKGTAKQVSVTGISAGGTDAGNYSLNNTTASTTADITAKAITVTASGVNKVYDASVNDAATLASAGVISGDSVTFSDTSATFANKNVGSTKTVSVAGIFASGTDAGNYTLNNTTASTTADITAKAITVTATGVNKVYDALVSDAVTLSSAGVISGDVVSFADTSATFADKNVGTGKTVSVSGISFSGADAGNYTLNNTTASSTADITAKALTVSGITATSRVYDGTTNATLNVNTAIFGGYITGDNVQVASDTISGSFSDKNVGINKTVNLTGVSITGADAANYTLNGVAGVNGSITPLSLTVTGVAASNKVYDATTLASLTGSAVVAALPNDTVNVIGGAGAFADKNVAQNKSVTVTGYSLSGADAGNYTLVQPTGLKAEITPLAITVSATGVNKVYDGKVNANVTLASADVMSGDSVSFTDSSAAFNDKNVGAGKGVFVTGISAAGTDNLNYTYNTTASTTANITPAPLSVIAGNATRPYGAENPLFTFSYNGFVNGEIATVLDLQPLASTTAVQTSNAGSYVITPSGASGINYTINYVNGTLKIVPLVMTGESFTFPVGSQSVESSTFLPVSPPSTRTVNAQIVGMLGKLNWEPSVLAVTAPAQWGKLSVIGDGILMPADSAIP
jgi:filamentous hemagglutinin family protein